MLGRDYERKLQLSQALANISNALWGIQHRKYSWDEKIKSIQEIQKLLPLIIRCMVYFKNIEPQQEADRK